jgi:hypothetical protein
MNFYCRSYCLLNMFRAPLCPSSGAREYYTVGCCLWSLVLLFSNCRYDVELRVVCPVCGLLQHLLHLVGILFPHINDDVRSKSLQNYEKYSLWLGAFRNFRRLYVMCYTYAASALSNSLILSLVILGLKGFTLYSYKYPVLRLQKNYTHA